MRKFSKFLTACSIFILTAVLFVACSSSAAGAPLADDDDYSNIKTTQGQKTNNEKQPCCTNNNCDNENCQCHTPTPTPCEHKWQLLFEYDDPTSEKIIAVYVCEWDETHVQLVSHNKPWTIDETHLVNFTAPLWVDTQNQMALQISSNHQYICYYGFEDLEHLDKEHCTVLEGNWSITIDNKLYLENLTPDAGAPAPALLQLIATYDATNEQYNYQLSGKIYNKEGCFDLYKMVE